MNDFNQKRRNLIAARQAFDAGERALHATRGRLNRIEERLKTLARSGRANPNDGEGGVLLRERSKLQSLLASQESELSELRQTAGRVFSDFIQLPRPQQLIEQLDDRIPFLLLPMRLETKFMRIPGEVEQHELWVRIFPDDIAVQAHEEPLTEDEREAGIIYWEETWRAAGNRERALGAWRVLVSGYDAPRAAWIAKTLEPLNNNEERRPPEELPPGTPLDPPPDFPETNPNQATWTRAPRVRVMPDRFVIVTYVGEEMTHEVMGNPLPDPLIVGPDPLQLEKRLLFGLAGPDLSGLIAVLNEGSIPESLFQAFSENDISLSARATVLVEKSGQSWTIKDGLDSYSLEPEEESLNIYGGGFRQKDGELLVDASMEWMIDFDKALEIGMAVRIPITPGEAESGFDRVIALGVRLSSDEQDGKARLENLLEDHHYAAGLALIPQGTPTNNTESGRSGFRSYELGDETTFAVEREEPLFESLSGHFEKRDGQRLAEALGINPEILQHVYHSNGSDYREAMAMNRALWPGTLGYFMEEMMDPVFSLETIRKTRAFFTNFVAGRGALPVMRVGNQPYGILPATVFSRWKWPSTHEKFFTDLLEVLLRMNQHWASLVGQLTHAGAGTDSDKELLEMLGLQASSVEFYQRFAVGPDYPWNLAVFTGNGSQAQTFSDLQRTFARVLLSDLGYDFQEVPFIFKTTFFRDQTRLDGPLIDNNPLSEINPIQPIAEDIGNYIHWLGNAASIETIRDQDFGTDEEGQRRPAPRTLLYLWLRHAYLLQKWDTALRLFVREELVPEIARRELEMLNIRPPAGAAADSRDFSNISRWDYFESSIPAVTGELKMGDFLFTEAIVTLPEASELREHKAALPVLADLPTARLERLFAEHLDLCSYRLDAWLGGVVNFRLQELRGPGPVVDIASATRGSAEATSQGIYLGAYGWLEDLRPAPSRQRVPEAEIPEGFEEADGAPLTYAPDNAGFIHAPSLNQAAAAAILRNGFITHQDKEKKELMSIDLSSERVRRALWYLEGIRNGQKLGALLGYRFERGLHDRNATLRLDQFILPIRKKFPLVADQATEADPAEPIEALEARNVVNGLKLVKAARDIPYPYGVTGPPLLPGATTPEGRAIQAEVARITDDLDALSDLTLAESVYSVVQGNFDRAGAVLKTTSEAARPPEIDIVRTPRNGISLTHRVTINFHQDAAAENPWPGVDLSPRAEAEARLNHWLGQMLGEPENIRCRVAYRNPASETPDELIEEVQLKELNLQPLDFIYLTGRDLQDEATELENRIAYEVRKRKSLTRETALNIRFMERKPEWELRVKTFFEMLPLANGLREIVAGCRPLAADDFSLPSDVAEDLQNRKRFDLIDLQTRARAALEALEDPLNDEDNFLNKAINELRDSTADPVPPALFENLRNALLKAALLGIPDAIPASALETSEAVKNSLIEQGEGALAEMKRRQEAGEAALSTFNTSSDPPDVKFQHLIEVFKAVFGRAFNPLPLFSFSNPEEWQLALSPGNALSNATRLVVNEWLQGLAAVRPRIANYHNSVMLADTFEHHSPQVTAAQLPFIENDTWLALPFDAERDEIGDKLSFAMQLAEGYSPAGGQAGFLVDEFVEVIPIPHETTGIAFHFDQPNSEPPQCLLLAITPEITGNWKWEDLLDTLHETLEMAKKRAVEPDTLGNTPYAQLLPGVMNPATRFPATISFDQAVNIGVINNPEGISNGS